MKKTILYITTTLLFTTNLFSESFEEKNDILPKIITKYKQEDLEKIKENAKNDIDYKISILETSKRCYSNVKVGEDLITCFYKEDKELKEALIRQKKENAKYLEEFKRKLLNGEIETEEVK
jgi:hypothetical protein